MTESSSDAIAALEVELDALIEQIRGEPKVGPVPEWILPPRSCRFLESVAALFPDDSTGFEFGSGRSTHALRRILSGVTSVEDSGNWLEQTEKHEDAIAKRAADHSAVIPLERCWNRLRMIESFPIERHANELTRLKRAALILVDSPPNPAKREHALFVALREARPGAVVILDDLEVAATARFAERLARQNSKQFRFWDLDIDHRLGVFLKRRSGRVRSLPSPREFVGTWLRV